MNTKTLKKFAQEARKKLISQIGAKLELVLTSDSAELREKASQIKKLQEEINATSKEQVIEKVAYTWFNRLMALRFMDANEYQPIGMRVVTPKDSYTLPEILDEAKQGNIPDELPVNQQHIYDVLDGKIPSNNAQNEAYKELLIGACNHLNKVFPFLFEKLSDYSELLLPDDLISEFSIIQDVRDWMTAEDCQDVEIIGWLYQFYISEKKDEVFASKSKVKKEDIPAATQLFTPRWIVEYMVQNTVGKLWLQNNPNSKLREHMPYFIESPSVESDDYLKINSVEELTLLDQACGSGHILVYGFELLTKIYEEEGYNPTEIPQLIIEKNLFGFEIDERAAQLAGLALMMKARSYNRRVFKKELEPNILCYQDLKLSTDEIKEVFRGIGIDLSDELLYDLKNMQQATNFGSLIIPHTSLTELEKVDKTIQSKSNTSDAFLGYQLEQLTFALYQLIPLRRKYHCVVDNPPYMGGGAMNKELAQFVKTNYPASKADLMTCFMEAGWDMLLPKGILGMINLPSWLFLSSFKKLRIKLIKEKHIDSLLHMGRGIFGVDWGSTAFIIQNQQLNKDSKYFKLHKRNFQHLYPKDIQQIFLKAKNDSSTKINFDKYREEDEIASINDLIDDNGLQISYTTNQKSFEKISGSPIGYWLSENAIKVFEKESMLGSSYEATNGMFTCNNERFLRRWFEASINSTSIVQKNKYKWVPYNKGGDYRKWYGNQEYILNYINEGEEVRNYRKESGQSNKLPGEKYFFKEYITWTDVSSIGFSARFVPKGTAFDIAGSALCNTETKTDYILGLLNSCVSSYLFNIFNPTLHFQVGNIRVLPLITSNTDSIIDSIVKENVSMSTLDWDANEKAWNFNQNELIRIKGQDLEETYDLYQQYWKNKFFQLHKNEEKLNQQFINTYGLQEELTPEVPLKYITILKEETDIVNGELVFDTQEIFAQFMSYAAGCMFGRYSLDKEGLILANQGETLEDYLEKVGMSETEVSFLPDDDNIIPILDDEWFEDDIVNRFNEFLKASFGKANFEKNLAFVEECLGKDIRKYFVKDFYVDHIKRYKKRPIYWMFSSPKGSFNVLIYMHRYTPDTLNQILNGYLKEYREKLNTHIEHLDHLIESGSSSEQTKASKEKDKLKLVIIELQEYERDVLYPLATERIAIGLDDGVLVNYNKFGTAIKKVAGLNDKKAKDKVLQFDWIDVKEIR